ncbi:MAG: hypothetical protein V4628_11565 [Pseudomonadota bacterium]
MTSPQFKLAMLPLILLLLVTLMISGCELGQTVMVSKGQAGGFRELINGDLDYCKITMTPGVTISDAAQEAFVNYCADVE